MKKVLITLSIGYMMQYSICAQSLFDPTWANRFQEVLDSVVVANNVKGASSAVYVPWEGIWIGTSGIASPGVPMAADKRLFIGSNTKLFIAVTIMKLQELGTLTLEDHLYQWLPAYPYVDSTTTIRQLLSHQSGIFDYLNDGSTLWNAVLADTSHFWTPDEILATIGSPHFAPGHGCRYSNTNYLLAGMIIEEATDTTWVQKLHDVIFDPLDMDSTFVAVFETQNGPIAPQYCFGYWHYTLETSYYSVSGPAGSIFSTAREMVEWYRALFNNEIISSSSLQEILDIEASSFFGLGIWGNADPSLSYPFYYHTGAWGDGYISQIMFDTITGSVLCLLTNGGVNTVTNLPFLIDPLMNVLHNDYPRKSNDAGIVGIIQPWDNICTPQVTPMVILKNFGSNPLTSVTIISKIDNGSPLNLPWTGFLNPGDSMNVSLSSLTPGIGYHKMICYTSFPNGLQEGYNFNDTTASNFIINDSAAIPVPWFEGFENPEFPPDGWIENPLVMIQWGHTSLASYEGTASAVKCNYWDSHIGNRYNLDLPMLDLNTVNNPTLSFWYAYTYYPGYADSLKILISSDCGINWQTLFYDGGLSLRTAPPTTQLFYPTTSQWDQKSISLSGYSGNALIRFQEICGFGNNLFIDNVEVGYPAGFDNQSITDNQLRIMNHPNPFLESTTFFYTLKESSEVTILIFNSFGKLVEEPINIPQAKGEQKVKWNAGNLPAGIYFYRIQEGEHVGSRKMMKIE